MDIQEKSKRSKHILIEILPRAFWLIEIGTLVYFSLHFGVERSSVLMLIGLAVILFGIVVLAATFRDLFKAMFSKKLVISGIYKKVRHPMYAAMYLILTGVGLVYFSWLWFVVMLIFIPIWYLIATAEENQMTDLYPIDYPDYKKQTRMFF